MDKQRFEEMLECGNLTKRGFAVILNTSPQTIYNWGKSQNIPYWVESWLSNYIALQEANKKIFELYESSLSDKVDPNDPKEITSESLPSSIEAQKSTDKNINFLDIKPTTETLWSNGRPAENFIEDILNYDKKDPDKVSDATKAIMQSIEKMIDEKLKDKEDKK